MPKAKLTPVVLAIDQGTTNSKAFLFSEAGDILARASAGMSVSHPQPGWAELDAMSVWETVRDTVNTVVANGQGCEIKAVAITNQRESIVLWDSVTGTPLGPCVIWQCRRSSQTCDRLRAAGYEDIVVRKSGLGLDPLFPAGKLAMLLDAVPDGRARAERGEVKAGTVDSWLLWNLTGGSAHATDASNAARTQLMNIDTLQWDSELAALFNVPLNILPVIRPSNSLFGTTVEGVTALPAGIRIHAIMGDSHAALYGHGINRPGRIKATLGTGSSLMVATKKRVHSQHGLSSTIAWSTGTGGVHALEGNISVSGQTAAYVTRLLGLPDEQALTALALSVPDNGGVTFVPALAGLGAPHWNDKARGLINGMSLSTQPAHIARAALEAIALQIRDVFVAMEADLDTSLSDISVDGGATLNDTLMQWLADVLDRPVLRPNGSDITALGVSNMAAKALGLWDPAASGVTKRFEPKMSADRRLLLLTQWNDAIMRAKQ